jgi:hypothetical protein
MGGSMTPARVPPTTAPGPSLGEQRVRSRLRRIQRERSFGRPPRAAQIAARVRLAGLGDERIRVVRGRAPRNRVEPGEESKRAQRARGEPQASGIGQSRPRNAAASRAACSSCGSAWSRPPVRRSRDVRRRRASGTGQRPWRRSRTRSTPPCSPALPARTPPARRAGSAAPAPPAAARATGRAARCARWPHGPRRRAGAAPARRAARSRPCRCTGSGGGRAPAPPRRADLRSGAGIRRSRDRAASTSPRAAATSFLA